MEGKGEREGREGIEYFFLSPRFFRNSFMLYLYTSFSIINGCYTKLKIKSKDTVLV